MINVYQFYKDVEDRINKEENGYLKPDQFNRLLQYSSNELQGFLVEELQDVSKTDKHQKIYDLLFPFNKRVVLSINKGEVVAPEDYEHFSSLRIRYDDAAAYNRIIEINNKICEATENSDPTIDMVELQEELEQIRSEDRFTDVKVYPHDKISNRLNSSITSKRPQKHKPVAEYASKAWKVYPKDVSSALLLYYRKPAEAKLVMKVNPATGDQEYSAADSVNIEWPEKAKTDLLNRIVSDFAIYIREPGLFQFMDAKANQNNTKK